MALVTELVTVTLSDSSNIHKTVDKHQTKLVVESGFPGYKGQATRVDPQNSNACLNPSLDESHATGI